MSLLNPPQILPNVAFLVYRALLRFPQGIGIDDIAHLLAHPVDQEGSVIEITIRGLRDIGLFEIDNQAQVSLGAPLNEHEPGSNPRLERNNFRRAVVDLVLAESANNYPPESEGGATDLVRGLCWYLLQNPSDAPSRFQDSGNAKGAASVKAAQLRTADDTVLRNDTRWGSFTRWSTYLGFCRWRDRGIVPEPTVVVADALRHSISEVGALPISTAIQAIGEVIPVLDQGRYWTEMTKLIPQRLAPTSGEVSAALSQSLLRLNETNQIRLTRRSDADALRFRLEQERREEFSHIEISR